MAAVTEAVLADSSLPDALRVCPAATMNGESRPSMPPQPTNILALQGKKLNNVQGLLKNAVKKVESRGSLSSSSPGSQTLSDCNGHDTVTIDDDEDKALTLSSSSPSPVVMDSNAICVLSDNTTCDKPNKDLDSADKENGDIVSLSPDTVSAGREDESRDSEVHTSGKYQSLKENSKEEEDSKDESLLSNHLKTTSCQSKESTGKDSGDREFSLQLSPCTSPLQSKQDETAKQNSNNSDKQNDDEASLLREIDMDTDGASKTIVITKEEEDALLGETEESDTAAVAQSIPVDSNCTKEETVGVDTDCNGKTPSVETDCKKQETTSMHTDCKKEETDTMDTECTKKGTPSMDCKKEETIAMDTNCTEKETSSLETDCKKETTAVETNCKMKETGFEDKTVESAQNGTSENGLFMDTDICSSKKSNYVNSKVCGAHSDDLGSCQEKEESSSCRPKHEDMDSSQDNSKLNNSKLCDKTLEHDSGSCVSIQKLENMKSEKSICDTNSKESSLCHLEAKESSSSDVKPRESCDGKPKESSSCDVKAEESSSCDVKREESSSCDLKLEDRTSDTNDKGDSSKEIKLGYLSGEAKVKVSGESSKENSCETNQDKIVDDQHESKPDESGEVELKAEEHKLEHPEPLKTANMQNSGKAISDDDLVDYLSSGDANMKETFVENTESNYGNSKGDGDAPKPETLRTEEGSTDDVDMIDIDSEVIDDTTDTSDIVKVLGNDRKCLDLEPDVAVVVLKDKIEPLKNGAPDSSQDVLTVDDDDDDIEIMDDSMIDKSYGKQGKNEPKPATKHSTPTPITKQKSMVKINEELIDLDLEADDDSPGEQAEKASASKPDLVEIDDEKKEQALKAENKTEVEHDSDIEMTMEDRVPSKPSESSVCTDSAEQKPSSPATKDDDLLMDTTENSRKRSADSEQSEPSAKKVRLDTEVSDEQQVYKRSSTPVVAETVEEEKEDEDEDRILTISVKNLRELVKMHVQKHHHKELTLLKKKTEELTTSVLRWQTTAVSLQCKVAEITQLKAIRKREKLQAAASKASTSTATPSSTAPTTAATTVTAPASSTTSAPSTSTPKPLSRQSSRPTTTAGAGATTTTSSLSSSVIVSSSTHKSSSPAASSPSAAASKSHHHHASPSKSSSSAAAKSQPSASSSKSQAAAAASKQSSGGGGGMTIDLTEEEEPAPPKRHSQGKSSMSRPTPPRAASPDIIMTKCDIPAHGSRHPAPLPLMPMNQAANPSMKTLPPKPGLKISRVPQGIVLSWNMTVGESHAQITNYQLFAYQEGNAMPVAALWKKVGDVKALPLPMACTLTQFQIGNKYHFAVRAMDVHNRVGAFSDPCSIHLQ